MDIQTLLNAISTVGFPIVACCAMFYIMYQNTKVLEAIKETLVNINLRIDDLEDAIKRGGEQ